MLDTESSSSCEVIFGSSFAGDSEYHQFCRNINHVKICMEMGKTVVLLNLRSVMESLYELLNQYFIEYGRGDSHNARAASGALAGCGQGRGVLQTVHGCIDRSKLLGRI
jgi:hypothetical protein